MRSHRPRRFSTSVVLAQYVGVLHYFVANIVAIVGQFIPAFDSWGKAYPGLQFVYQTLDRPIASRLSDFAALGDKDMFLLLLTSQVIFLLASALYAFIAYGIFKLLSFLF